MFSSVFAQTQAEPRWYMLEQAISPSLKFAGAGPLTEFFNKGLINIIFFVAGAALLFFVITSGLSMMMSRGEPKAVEGAKARLTQAVIGFAIIFFAYWIVQIVGLMLDLPGFGGIFGNGGNAGTICTNCMCGGTYCDGACTAAGCIPR